MINKLYSILALSIFSGLVNAYTVYDNRAAWEVALPTGSNIFLEDFDDKFMKKPELVSYTVFEGSFTQEFQSKNLISADDSTFNTQAFKELADGAGTTVWNFSSPSIAFGGNWDLAGPAGPGTGLAIKINGVIQTFEIASTYDGGFWGFVAGEEDPAFLTVELLRPDSAAGVESELYHLDDMVVASVVPLPAAIWLLGSGFIGLLGYKKRFSH